MTTLPSAAGLLARDPHALGAWLPQFRKWAVQAKGAWVAEEVSQEVAIRCLKLMRSGGFPCATEEKLRGYMFRMVEYAVIDARRRKGRQRTQTEGDAIERHASEEPIAREVWVQFAETRTRALGCIKTTPEQRAALDRRIECALGAELVTLLIRDGKLAANAAADERQRAVDSDMRLQRSSLSILQKGLDLACANAVIDPDATRFAQRVVDGLRERATTPAAKSKKDPP